VDKLAYFAAGFEDKLGIKNGNLGGLLNFSQNNACYSEIIPQVFVDNPIQICHMISVKRSRAENLSPPRKNQFFKLSTFPQALRLQLIKY
jgi:hypothetical protein